MALADSLTRQDLAQFLPNQRSIRAFEQAFETVDVNTEGVETAQQTADGAQQTADQAVQATNDLKGASYVVLSNDSILTNERVLTPGNLIAFDDGGPDGDLTVKVDRFTLSGTFTLAFNLTANTGVTLPTAGTLATLAGAETLSNKTLDALRVQTAFTAGAPTPSGSIPITVDGVTKYIVLSDAP